MMRTRNEERKNGRVEKVNSRMQWNNQMKLFLDVWSFCMPLLMAARSARVSECINNHIIRMRRK